MLRTSLTLFCVLYITRPGTEAAAGDALNSDAAAKLCGFSDKAKKAAARTAAKLANTASYLKSAQAAAARLTAFAMAEATWAEPAIILAAYLTGEAERQLTDLSSKMATAVRSAGQAAYAGGRIDELVLLFKHAQHSTPSSGLCISKQKTADTAADAEATESCTAGDLTAAAPDATNLQEAAIQVFSASTALTGATANSCALTAAVLTAYKKDTGNMLLLDGLIEIANGGGFDTGNLKKTAAETNVLKPIATTYTATHDYLSNGDPTDEVTAEALDKIIKPDVVGAKLKDTINSFYQYNPAKEENDIKKIATELFKIPADGSETGFIKALKKAKARVPTRDQPEPQDTMQLDYQQLAREEAKALQSLNKKANKKGPDCSNELSEGSEAYKKAEETCNKLKEAAACNANPICIYNTTESEENKKCKFDAKKATSNGVPKAETQTGGTEKTTEKCKGKLEDACKKDTECKWEENKCKDSSILLNKKFALSVVSAAFVALLF
uniref:Variant surface glycoprotein 1125.4210 n=1 Tax=Trypanosoma brucei TaxID=5691 RepID=M4T1U7_9TRYP|nr:variant surface glycoprotein 495 [Trypanosoma brucei]APD74737.1 variant surface glycoprotein 1125.4210 [Trypanosoma brucei]